jgi:GTP-binding protein YchF
VKISDERLEEVSSGFGSRKTVFNSMEFLDIPGFDPAHTERKLKNAVLEHYRKSDALALTINLFDPTAAVQAASGMRSLLEELTLTDLVNAESAAKRLQKAAQLRADPNAVAKHVALAKVQGALEEGTSVRRVELSPDEERLFREYAFLSALPVIAVSNVADDDFAKDDAEIPGMADVLAVAQEEGLGAVRVAASLEAELADLPQGEAQEYMAEYGLGEAALPRFIRAAFDCLGLITFFTGTEKECRAWSLPRGANAQSAAGVVHSDMARGFIRAETVSYDDYVQYGGTAGAKAAGKMRLEGKDYVVADGDVLLIRFNV